MTRIAVTTTWACATGVAVMLSYCVLTSHKNTKEDQKKAAAVAERISKRGTIAEYKPASRRCSAVSKSTVAKVVNPDVKPIVYVPNPIYPSFTNALFALQQEYADAVAECDVALTNGFVLTLKDAKPYLQFPEAYRISAGGFEIGSQIPCGRYGVSYRCIPGTDKMEVTGIALHQKKRLDEPDLYCTHAVATGLPSTGQIDSLQMYGDLKVVNTGNAKKVVEEIAGHLVKDYAASELESNVPAGTLAKKVFRIGTGMDVCVTLDWKRHKTDDGSDATVRVSFGISELEEEKSYQRKKLGDATDAARQKTLSETGVNYFTVDPKVNAEIGKDKIVR